MLVSLVWKRGVSGSGAGSGSKIHNFGSGSLRPNNFGSGRIRIWIRNTDIYRSTTMCCTSTQQSANKHYLHQSFLKSFLGTRESYILWCFFLPQKKYQFCTTDKMQCCWIREPTLFWPQGSQQRKINYLRNNSRCSSWRPRFCSTSLEIPPSVSQSNWLFSTS